MSSKNKIPTPYLPNLEQKGEKIYARIWAYTADREGQRPNPINGVPRITKQSKKRANLRTFFSKHPGDISVREIQEKVTASADTIRRCCMEFVKEGWLAARRTKDGYYFKADVPKLNELLKTNQI